LVIGRRANKEETGRLWKKKKRNRGKWAVAWIAEHRATGQKTCFEAKTLRRAAAPRKNSGGRKGPGRDPDDRGGKEGARNQSLPKRSRITQEKNHDTKKNRLTK